MVKLSEIRALIDAYIKTNGNQEITGHTMNVLLNEIVRILDERKQDVLVSGENIKTIGGMSLLGEGDIPGYDDTEIRNLINAVVTAVEDQNGKIAEVAESVQEQGKKLTELSAEIEGKEDKANKTTTLSSASTDTQYPSARATFMAIRKKSEVSLEALANGNLKVTIDGVSKDFMAATPSGDPQHYAFMAIGAKYNATANDSSVAAPWAALADDAADKVVIHKAGHWLLNGVGDLTNRDMRHILAKGAAIPGVVYSMANAISDYYNKDKNPGANAVRTNYCFAGTTNFTVEMGAFFNNQVIEVIELSARPNGAQGSILTKTMYFARLATNLRHIVGICIPNDTNADAFTGSPLIKTIDVRELKYNINFKDQPLLTNASILNMINKEMATNAIVITLHADAYARAMANTNIQSALAAHPNVSLAKA